MWVSLFIHVAKYARDIANLDWVSKNKTFVFSLFHLFWFEYFVHLFICICLWSLAASISWEFCYYEEICLEYFFSGWIPGVSDKEWKWGIEDETREDSSQFRLLKSIKEKRKTKEFKRFVIKFNWRFYLFLLLLTWLVK